jgi:hypothetical protein
LVSQSFAYVAVTVGPAAASGEPAALSSALTYALLLLLPPGALQTASFLFKPEFLAAGGASSALLEPLMRILSLGWSSAAVTTYVQGVSHSALC